MSKPFNIITKTFQLIQKCQSHLGNLYGWCFLVHLCRIVKHRNVQKLSEYKASGQQRFRVSEASSSTITGVYAPFSPLRRQTEYSPVLADQAAATFGNPVTRVSNGLGAV